MSVSLLVSNIQVTGSNIIYNANLTGIGGTLVIQSGDKVLISGVSAGINQSQLNALSGFVTGVSGALNISISNSVSGLISTGNADLRYYPNSGNPSGYVTGDYYTKDQIDALFQSQNPYYFRGTVTADISGNYMTQNYPTGLVATTGVFLNAVTDQFLTGFITPSGYPGFNGMLNGEVVASIHVKKGNINQQYTNLYFKLFKYNSGVSTLIKTSLAGQEVTPVEQHSIYTATLTGTNLISTDRLILNWYANIQGTGPNPDIYLMYGNDTASALSIPISNNVILQGYYLNSNPSGFITTGQTGQFYPISNPQQYTTSGNLTQTGVIIEGQINSLSGYVGNVSGALQAQISLNLTQPQVLSRVYCHA